MALKPELCYRTYQSITSTEYLATLTNLIYLKSFEQELLKAFIVEDEKVLCMLRKTQASVISKHCGRLVFWAGNTQQVLQINE